MKIEIHYFEKPDYLSVKVSGQWTTENAKKLFELMRDEADKHGLTLLFLDARGLSQPDTEMTRFFSGEYFAKVLPFPFKTAIVTNPEIYNKFGETVALNRCAQIAVFFKKEEARKWLIKKSEV
ncbi:MAG: STAS/SEC14 domain-containing protein [Calditrichaeota bacterium]|nr:STAS/SEC14 domain-containing protein [Calditrichota bacterium]